MEKIELTHEFPVPPKTVYEAWMNSEGHTAMTGGGAEISPIINGNFTAWDGYIWGKTLELVANNRIRQTWRTSEFPDDAPDSQLEVVLRPNGNGTELTLRHWNLQPGDGAKYSDGWVRHYFEPMTEHWGATANS